MENRGNNNCELHVYILAFSLKSELSLVQGYIYVHKKLGISMDPLGQMQLIFHGI
jgi:hypothetical protein